MVSSLVELNECYKELYSKLYVGEAKKEGFGNIRKTFQKVLKDKIPKQMKWKLTQSITEYELHSTLEAMAKGKTTRPDGVVMEFFFNIWLVTGKEYIEMV